MEMKLILSSVWLMYLIIYCDSVSIEKLNQTAEAKSPNQPWVHLLKNQVNNKTRQFEDIGDLNNEYDYSDTILFNGNYKANLDCQPRISFIDEVEYEHETQCKEIAEKECVNTFKTLYTPSKVKECDEYFKKECFIEYEPSAAKTTVRTCNEVFEKDCDIPGPLVCEDVQKTTCNTEFNVDTHSEDTTCEQEVATVCGPEKCGVKSKEVCNDWEKEIVKHLPKEQCSIVPYKDCKLETRLIPSLESILDCDHVVPKEVCATIKLNPRKVKKMVSKWICLETSGAWGPYGDWSECQGLCGSGTQIRRRICLEPEKDCEGFDFQTRVCEIGKACDDQSGTSPAVLVTGSSLDSSNILEVTETEYEVIVPIKESIIDTEEVGIISGIIPNSGSSSFTLELETSAVKSEEESLKPEATVVIESSRTSGQNFESSTLSSNNDEIEQDKQVYLTEPQTSKSNVTLKNKKDTAPCHAEGVQFLSHDVVKKHQLNTHKEEEAANLCFDLCKEEPECKFYNSYDTGEDSSTCILMASMTSIVDNAPGVTAGIRDCL